MTTTLVSAFLTYTLITAMTPGPNNILALSAANQHGLRRSSRVLAGMSAGFLLIMLLCALFTFTLISLSPALVDAEAAAASATAAPEASAMRGGASTSEAVTATANPTHATRRACCTRLRSACQASPFARRRCCLPCCGSGGGGGAFSVHNSCVS